MSRQVLQTSTWRCMDYCELRVAATVGKHVRGGSAKPLFRRFYFNHQDARCPSCSRQSLASSSSSPPDACKCIRALSCIKAYELRQVWSRLCSSDEFPWGSGTALLSSGSTMMMSGVQPCRKAEGAAACLGSCKATRS